MRGRAALTSGKNASIQLLRILCSIFVIACHVYMNYRVIDGVIHYDILLSDAFVRCCVPVFLMISGMFMFRGKPLKSVAKTAGVRIALPLFLTCVFLQLLNPFLVENSYTLGAFDFKPVASAFMKFSAEPIVNGFYLWYVFLLLTVYFWYPLLQLLCVNDPTANRNRIYLLVLGFLATIATMTVFAMFPSWQYQFNIPNPLGLYGVFYVVLGYEISQGRFKMEKGMGKTIGLLLYILGVATMIILTLYFDIAPDKEFNHVFFEYDTLGVMLAALGFLLFFLHTEIKATALKKAINFLGNRTFAVYLIHWPVILKFDYSGLTSFLRERFSSLFFPLYILLCFVISLAIAIIIHFIKKAFIVLAKKAYTFLAL